jgi:uncharacterized protein (TIGR02284 family)
MRRNIINIMNRLTRLDLAAIRAYEQAIEGAKSTEIRRKLTEFMADHYRHVHDLQALVSASGGKPAKRRGLLGTLLQGFTAVLARGDRSALFAMHANEALINRNYAMALRRSLPEDMRALIARNYTDEKRHLAWIKEAQKALASTT